MIPHLRYLNDLLHQAQQMQFVLAKVLENPNLEPSLRTPLEQMGDTLFKASKFLNYANELLPWSADLGQMTLVRGRKGHVIGVRVNINRSYTRDYKYFSVQKYGSLREAYDIALAHRNNRLEEIKNEQCKPMSRPGTSHLSEVQKSPATRNRVVSARIKRAMV